MGSLPHGQLQQNQLPDAQLENEDPLSGLWETNWPSYYTGTAVEDWSSFGNIQAPQSATYLGEYNNSRSFILSDESNDLSHLPLRYLSDSSAFYNPLLAFPSPTNLSSSLDQANLQDPISWSSGLNNFSSQGHHWINKSTNSLPPKLSPNNRLLSADTNTVGDGSSETTIEIFKSLDLPYNQLVYRALTSTENYRMTTDEIYKWFEKNTEKVKSRNWKRSVRSTLTDFLAFQRVTVQETRYWQLIEEKVESDPLGRQGWVMLKRGKMPGDSSVKSELTSTKELISWALMDAQGYALSTQAIRDRLDEIAERKTSLKYIRKALLSSSEVENVGRGYWKLTK